MKKKPIDRLFQCFLLRSLSYLFDLIYLKSYYADSCCYRFDKINGMSQRSLSYQLNDGHWWGWSFENEKKKEKLESKHWADFVVVCFLQRFSLYNRIEFLEFKSLQRFQLRDNQSIRSNTVNWSLITFTLFRIPI